MGANVYCLGQDASENIKIQIKKLKAKNPQERAIGAINLGKMAEKAASAVPPLVELLNDNRKVKFKIDGKTEESTSPANEAAKSLGEIKDVRAVDPLITIINNHLTDTVLLGNTVWALGEIKDKKAVKPLIELLKEQKKKRDELFKANNPFYGLMDVMNQQICNALSKITGVKEHCDLEKWEAWLKGNQ